MYQVRYELTSECHIFPAARGDGDEYIAYFPLKSLALRVNRPAADLLETLKHGAISSTNSFTREMLDLLVGMKVVNGRKDRNPRPAGPRSPVPRRTMLLTSDRCNLKCVYCYGKAETVGELMPYEIAEAAVDEIVRNAVRRKQPSIEVGFHGGGEPTLNWEVLTGAVAHARERCREHRLRLITTICTNGVLPESRVRWLAENINSITVSIDGPPEIQNAHRPLSGGGSSFDHVAGTIDLLDELGKAYVFRVTSTKMTEGRLPEVFRFLATRFHPRVICVEPLFVCGRCATSRCEPPSAAGFTEDVVDTLELSQSSKVGLQYSGGRVFFLDSKFCGAAGDNFFVTPKGDVTSCVEVSTREDRRAETFIYGKYSPETRRFEFDLDVYRRLTTLRVEEFPSCKDCFARWHCSGDCLAKAPDMSRLETKRNDYRCEINREVTKHQILLEVDRPARIPPSGVKVKGGPGAKEEGS